MNIKTSLNEAEELQHLKEVFHANGYPDRVIKRTSTHTCRQGDDEENDGESEKPKILYLP